MRDLQGFLLFARLAGLVLIMILLTVTLLAFLKSRADLVKGYLHLVSQVLASLIRVTINPIGYERVQPAGKI